MNRKGLTREMVELKASGLSYSEIARRYGVSRQRIQQYFMPPQKIKIEVADRAKALCENCGQFDQFGHYHHKIYDFDILNTSENILYMCIPCHLRLNGEPHYCKTCGKVIPKDSRRYCSPECQKAYYSVTAQCSNCDKVFTMGPILKTRLRRSESGLVFCSKRCQGLYLAGHFGFLVHPENIPKGNLSRRI